MSSDKEKDKERKEYDKKEEGTQQAAWYGAQPSMSELYRRYNEPGRDFRSNIGADEVSPDYQKKYDARSGQTKVYGPVAREAGSRLKSIGNKLRSIGRDIPGTGFRPSGYEFDMPDTPYEEEVFRRIPRASEKPSETFGPYIMRPPAYVEQKRVFNSDRPLGGGGAFMPYHGVSDTPPDTVSSFTDGIKIFTDRMANDARYFRGNVVSGYFNEDSYADNIGDIMLRSEEKGKTLYDLSKTDMVNMLNDISSERRRLEEGGEMSDAVLQGRTPEQYAASLDGQMEVLKSMIKARNVYNDPEKYESYIRSIYSGGGGLGMQIQREANTAREKMPVAEKWAKVGDIASSVVQNLAPLAVRAYSPWLGAASLVANLSANANSSMAEASMEMDSYEKYTGKKIDDAKRGAYIFGVGATDLILDALMQTYFFKNASMHSVSNFRAEIFDNIIGRQGTLTELRFLMKKLLDNSKRRLALAGKNILRSSSMQAGSEATQSVTRDLLTTLYRNPEDYPELTEVLANAAANAGIGFFVGGAMDVMSRRPSSLVGQRRNLIDRHLAFLKDKKGNLYQNLGVDRESDMYKAYDMSGNLRLVDPYDVLLRKKFNYDDYTALRKDLDKEGRGGRGVMPSLRDQLKESYRYWTMDQYMDRPSENLRVTPEMRKRNLINTNKIYRLDRDVNEIIGRGKEGKIYFDEPTGTYVDRELEAPVKEDIAFPEGEPLGSFRPGLHGSQREVYENAPFLSGDELTWRMFNPEEGDKWLVNNPFFNSVGPRIKHNYAIETPIKSPYRPYFYRDRVLSEDEQLKRMIDWMENRNKGDIGLPGYMNIKNNNIPDLSNLKDDKDYAYILGRIMSSRKNEDEFMKNAVRPLTELVVNGEKRKPLYRSEYGGVHNIPDVISPYEDIVLQTKELANRLRLKTRMYKTLADVPEKLRKKYALSPLTTSFYNSKEKEIGVIMENSSLIDVYSALMEYGIINRGLKKIFGDKTNDFLKEVYKKIPKEYQKHYYEGYPSNEEGAAAYLVDVATNPKMDDSDWNSFSSLARRFLKERFGIGEFKDVDLRYILWKAVNAIREDDSVKQMRKKSDNLRRGPGLRGPIRTGKPE